MMLFDPKAALEKIENRALLPANLATFQPSTPEIVAERAEVAAPGVEKCKK